MAAVVLDHNRRGGYDLLFRNLELEWMRLNIDMYIARYQKGDAQDEFLAWYSGSGCTSRCCLGISNPVASASEA